MPWSKRPPFQYVTATPLTATPLDGAEIYYAADPANGVVWHLRYNATSGSAYKWEFVGGSGLYSYVDTEQGTSSTSYTDLTTTGPSVTVPLAGDYEISFGARAYNANASQAGYMSYSIGATAASDTGAFNLYTVSANQGYIPVHFTARRRTITSASQAIVAKYRVSGGTAYFQDRVLKIDPVRVGF